MGVRFTLIALMAVSLAACNNYGAKSSRGFTLPDGDAAKGQVVYAGMGCSSCHMISDLPELRDDTEPQMTIKLGGETTHIKSYGELVTSVINPSHKLSNRYPEDQVSVNGVSKMTNYNDVLTVSELIDLVAFLQAQYEIYQPPKSAYPPYTY
jgi:mono/diheme cytochrome c family protein